MEEKKCIVIGVTGGIAVYKICSLVSSLKKQNYEVIVLMSEAAQKFVTPLTFQTLSGSRVVTDMFSVDYEPDVHHISIAKKADLFVIAPASANTIAKVANGIADNMLTTTFLAAKCKKLIVPAMNTGMLENEITQENIDKCKKHGMFVLESNSGYLACGDTGKGRMPEANEIEDKIKELLEEDQFLKGKKVLITAGPTQEALDPVRYLTNHSTGKMGYALAKMARNLGAEVTLVTGKTNLNPIRDVNMIEVTSAKEMAEAVFSYNKTSDVMILAAAVADFTPKEIAENKIHKTGEGMNLELVKTTDILETIGKEKRDDQILIGFAMETEKLLESARKKLEKKNCDYIVANNLKEQGAGFAYDTNKVAIISKDDVKEYPLLSKRDAAREILNYCVKGK